ncbi:plasmolipin [Oceanococcus atlanticus]|uniref:Plasmolipin n=2 Tax=Oceanococcus atlanticus TaxID=1317117 RepID=A0A1Y1SFG9_9GAMM|nr:plasmolipin [Oceanococcus atlanticus]
MALMRQWHWISSALCLIGMLLFSLTGITLNHASQIPATPVVTTLTGTLPQRELDNLRSAADHAAALPLRVRDWLRREWSLSLGPYEAEWLDDEVYLSLPRPGGDAWLSIALDDGFIEYERTDRGWVSYFNDLHKGRHAGPVWSWFIDIFAVACLIFCITGLVLLHMHAAQRRSTWPLVGLGLVVPAVLALLFIH